MPRRFKIKPSDVVPKCPNCGNNTEFVCHSEQVAEDGCEIWVNCVCGYDPTEGLLGSRVEDVMGGCDDANCLWAIQGTWCELVEQH